MVETIDIIVGDKTRRMTVLEALEFGKSREDDGDLSGAADVYQQIHNADPNQMDALHLLGVISHRLGEHELAAELITAAITIDPDFADAHSNLGVVYFDQERMDEAATCYERAISINPNYAGSHNNLGVLYQSLGRFEEAVTLFRKAIELSPDFQDAHANLGIALSNSGDPEEGLISIQKTLEMNPNHAMALTAAGGILFEQQKFDEAGHYLKQAANQDADFECGNVCFLGEDFDGKANPDDFDRLISNLPEINGTFPDESGAEPVVMSSCDYGYFRQFGPALALSVDQYAPGHDLHLHVINPEPSFDEEIADLKHRLGNTGLTVTTETAPGTDRLYFHVIRFVRLCQFMQSSEREFLHLDTDSLVHGALKSTDGIDSDADLSILTRFDTVSFNHKVAIGSLYVRQTPMARHFMRCFGAYLAHCIIENILVWGLDQTAFYVVYRMMTFNGEGVSLAPLPESLCDFDFGKGSDIWAAKGKLKNNEIFEQEASRLLGSSQV